MNKLSILLSFSFGLSFFAVSCGGSGASGSANKPAEKVYNQYTENRDQAAAVIEFRKKDEPKPLSFIVTGYYIYEAVYKSGMVDPSELKGDWLKFEDDFTYTYGSYNKQEGSGKYHHGLNTSMLLMLDDDHNTSPLEYELKIGSEFMIMVGRNTYGNNAVQMKLKSVSEKPKK